MIDVTKDTLLTMERASEFFPSRKGGHIQAQTVKKWASLGCRGIKLEVAIAGGALFTTADALREFARQLSAKRGIGKSPAPAIDIDADRRARAELKVMGFDVSDD